MDQKASSRWSRDEDQRSGTHQHSGDGEESITQFSGQPSDEFGLMPDVILTIRTEKARTSSSGLFERLDSTSNRDALLCSFTRIV